MQNKQYIHTNLLLYCSKKVYKFNQVSNSESEQRNFTHLIRCQKVKPYIILNSQESMLMNQFRNDVALWVKKLRGRYNAIFIEPENVNKIS